MPVLSEISAANSARSLLRSRSTITSLRLSRSAHQFAAPAYLVFDQLRSVFRSAHMLCSNVERLAVWHNRSTFTYWSLSVLSKPETINWRVSVYI